MALKNVQLSCLGPVSVYSVHGIEPKHRKDSLTRGSFLRHVNANPSRSLLAHIGVVALTEQEALQYMHNTQCEAVVQFYEHAL